MNSIIADLKVDNEILIHKASGIKVFVKVVAKVLRRLKHTLFMDKLMCHISHDSIQNGNI